MSDPELLMVLVAFACAAVLCVLWLRQVVLHAPVKDARWRDKPPLLWRASGPLVRGMAASIEPMMPARLSRRSTTLLHHAGRIDRGANACCDRACRSRVVGDSRCADRR
jgi:hypothetical protein